MLDSKSFSEEFSSFLLQFSSNKKHEKHKFTFFIMFLLAAKNSTEKNDCSYFYYLGPLTFSKKELAF